MEWCARCRSCSRQVRASAPRSASLRTRACLRFRCRPIRISAVRSLRPRRSHGGSRQRGPTRSISQRKARSGTRCAAIASGAASRSRQVFIRGLRIMSRRACQSRKAGYGAGCAAFTAAPSASWYRRRRSFPNCRNAASEIRCCGRGEWTVKFSRMVPLQGSTCRARFFSRSAASRSRKISKPFCRSTCRAARSW